MLERILMKALERDPDLRHPTAAALEAELLEFLSVEQILVPRSGVARLLTRVMGPTLEQRRKALGHALVELSRTEAELDTEPDLSAAKSPEQTEQSSASSHPPLEPTGSSGISSLSQVGPAVRTWRPTSGAGSQVPILLASLALMLITAYMVYQTRLLHGDPSITPASADAAAPQPEAERGQTHAERSQPHAEPTRKAPSPQLESSLPAADKSRIPLIKVEDLHVDSAGSHGTTTDPDARKETSSEPLVRDARIGPSGAR